MNRNVYSNFVLAGKSGNKTCQFFALEGQGGSEVNLVHASDLLMNNLNIATIFENEIILVF